MTSNPDYKLSQEQIDHFMRHGWVRVPGCFSREKAAEWTADVWTRLGFSPDDKSTWVTECTHMPEHKEEAVKTFAPKAWAAICELLGGESRVAQDSATWNDAFIVNLGTPEMENKWPNPQDLQGWHVDGDFFVHFLDSPEQGLLVIPLFTDIKEHAGGTMVCADAIKGIATHLVGLAIAFFFTFFYAIFFATFYAVFFALSFPLADTNASATVRKSPRRVPVHGSARWEAPQVSTSTQVQAGLLRDHHRKVSGIS